MPRLGHKKSRNGCRQCKARHVKCDELKPCSNCSRHGVLCSLIDPNSGPLVPPQVKREPSTASQNRKAKAESEPSQKTSSEQSTPASGLPIDYVLNPSPSATTGTSESDSPSSDPFPYLSKFVNKSDVIQPNYWVRDLELMHHWVTEAHLTVSPREDIGHMWRILTPKQAITRHYLMHELLAFSALHIASTQTDKTKAFYGLGIHHQDLAIRSMRKVLPNMTVENAGALAVTSALLCLTVFSARGLESALSTNEATSKITVVDDLLDIFYLMQGIGSILWRGAGAIAQGPFAAMLNRPLKDMAAPPLPILEDTRVQIEHITAFIGTQDLPAAEAATVKAALGGLEAMRQYALSAEDSIEIRFVFVTVLKFSPDFLELFRTRQSSALAVMSIYANLLKASEATLWFMKGWGERLIRTIGECIDPIWQPAIQWSWDYIIITPQEGSTQPSQSQLQPPLNGPSDVLVDGSPHGMQEHAVD